MQAGSDEAEPGALFMPIDRRAGVGHQRTVRDVEKIHSAHEAAKNARLTSGRHGFKTRPGDRFLAGADGC